MNPICIIRGWIITILSIFHSLWLNLMSLRKLVCCKRNQFSQNQINFSQCVPASKLSTTQNCPVIFCRKIDWRSVHQECIYDEKPFYDFLWKVISFLPLTWWCYKKYFSWKVNFEKWRTNELQLESFQLWIQDINQIWSSLLPKFTHASCSSSQKWKPLNFGTIFSIFLSVHLWRSEK